MNRNVLLVAGVVMSILCLTACSKYKTFKDEVAVLNTQYEAVAKDLFKKSYSERAEAINKAQQEYDEAFNVIAKKWKTDGKSEYLDFHEMFCKETVKDPYTKEVDSMVDKFGPEFVSVVRESMTSGKQNSDAVKSISTKLGVELGLLNVKFERMAKSNGCDFKETDTSSLIDRMMGTM